MKNQVTMIALRQGFLYLLYDNAQYNKIAGRKKSLKVSPNAAKKPKIILRSSIKHAKMQINPE